VAQMAMRGKWAEGIQPRRFHWILKDKLAICERPGGYGQHHRRVRRMEEIIWIRRQGFDRVVSIIDAPHNLHNYDEYGVAWLHRPYNPDDDTATTMRSLYPELHSLLESGNQVLEHREELGEHLSGLIAGYLVWAGMLPNGPQAISIVERMVDRQMGPVSRNMVSLALALRAQGGAPEALPQ
jgi:hypothetical protein